MPYKDKEVSRIKSRERVRKSYWKNHEKRLTDRKLYYEKNREKQCAASRAWSKRNRDHVAERIRRWRLLKYYGLSQEQYDAMGNACHICGMANRDSRTTKQGKKFRLSVDHVKGTKNIRGLLCGGCNCGIGYFKHDIALMERAIAYLKRDFIYGKNDD